MVKRFSELPAPALIVGSFSAVIILGGLLLKSPFAHEPGTTLTWIDAFFISASAVCVTGLVPLDVGAVFNSIGETVILLLIQTGGLGVMFLSSFIFLVVGRDVTMRQRQAVQETFTSGYEVNLKRLVLAIVAYVAAIELMGALLLTFVFEPGHGWARAAYLGFFHSISAFNNAGFSVLPDNLMSYCFNSWMNVLIIVLIVLGGVGFFVLWELVQAFQTPGRRTPLSLHTRVSLLTSVVLILGGTLLVWFLERNNTSLGPDTASRFWPSLFQATVSRTAGFNTILIDSLSNATIVLFFFLMFVGGSPGSTAGGIKTTTLAVLVMIMVSRLRGRSRVTLFNKSIPQEQVVRSIAIFVATAGTVVFFTFLLLVFDSSPADPVHGKIASYLFEAISAMGTVGFSMGITPHMNAVCKSLIILLMLIGRIGFLTMIYQALTSRYQSPFEYAEEEIMIG